MNRVSRNPRVFFAALNVGHASGVRVHYYVLLPDFCQIFFPFRLQSMATLKKGDQWQMWEFIQI